MKAYRTDEPSDKEKAASKKGKRSVKKGKRESEVLDLVRAKLEEIKETFWAYRMSQQVGGDKRPDINVCMTGNLHDQLFHIEAKHDEKRSLRVAFKQAVRQCKTGTRPVAVCK